MTNVTVQAGQTLLDLSIQYLGSEEKVFELAKLNNLSITTQLVTGQKINLPTVGNPRVVKVLKDGNRHPAANLENGTFEILEGVDFWGIEYDFIIS